MSSRLAKACEQWPYWPGALCAPPTQLKPLANGLTNTSYALNLDGRRVVLRLETENARVLGIDRTREIHILTLLNDSQITPRLLYRDASMGYSLFEYIEGPLWTEADLRNPDYQRQLQACVAQYQALSQRKLKEAHKLDYLSHLDAYRATLHHRDSPNPTLQHAAYRDFRASFAAFLPCAEWTLVHHDLNPYNLIHGACGPVIVDWEYAALGLKGFDEFCIQHQASAEDKSPDAPLFAQLLYWLNYYWQNLQIGNEFIPRHTK